MKYFLDTEFIEDGSTIELLSIGIVCEDGRELYSEVLGADVSRASDWVKQNVINNLWSNQLDKTKFNKWSQDGGKGGLLPKHFIVADIKDFCNPIKHGKPEFWGYYADYDWVVFCQLFGTMIQLPDKFPMYMMDIKQWCKQLGDPELPAQGKGEHHALADARWNKVAWEFLDEFSKDMGLSIVGRI